MFDIVIFLLYNNRNATVMMLMIVRSMCDILHDKSGSLII